MEPKEIGATSLAELEKLLLPLIRKATKIDVQPATQAPENAQLRSHFGGQPYFEESDEWPKSKNGRHMDFIFQIFNGGEMELSKSIQLIQFFYDMEEFPWETQNDGWHVKIYETLNTDKLKKIDLPEELEKAKYCEMLFKPILSLPDWEGIDLHGREAAMFTCKLDIEHPWQGYDKAVEQLIGPQDYQSQLGGYPRWVQGEATPQKSNGDNMPLLFQIDSEDNAGLMWGDVGLIYVFYDEEQRKFEFTLQCH